MNTHYMDVNILVVDDDRSTREFVNLQLMMGAAEIMMRVHIFEASNADDAWAIWKQNKIHGIVTDMVLAGSINGVQFLTEINKDLNNSDIPAVILTGMVDSYNVDKMWSCAEVMHKPMEPYFYKKCICWLKKVHYFWRTKELESVEQSLDAQYSSMKGKYNEAH